MTSRLLASLILLSSVAGAGCHRDVAPTTGPEPSEGAPEGSAPVAPRSTATPPAAPATFATRAEAVDASSTGQLALAALFVEAADTANSAQLELALRALGRTLGELRAGQYDEALVDAVRRLASPGRVAATTRVDGRTIVPAVELLLDIGDGAAIERLTEPYQAGAFAPLFSGSRALAARWQGAVTLRAGQDIAALVPSCALRLDGADAVLPASLTRGSHEVACGDGPARVFVAEPGELFVAVVDGTPRVIEPPAPSDADPSAAPPEAAEAPPSAPPAEAEPTPTTP
ncbi:MAG: hypothetical protein H6700_05965 [Myxococcales bacterium]|nr:hypothetical protein [Myxococcales bacterium]MCB9519394.1 hypothetical protein [Myxococcales bacterium]MCB9531293.1 hypothetical protein [Myxococcales bacterium]